MQEQNKKALLSIRQGLQDQRLTEQQVRVDEIKERTEWSCKRHGQEKTIVVMSVRNGKVTFKEDINRADSASLSVEKFLKFYHPKPVQATAACEA